MYKYKFIILFDTFINNKECKVWVIFVYILFFWTILYGFLYVYRLKIDIVVF